MIALAVAWLVVTRALESDAGNDPTDPGPALDASRQQRTIADMRAIGRANDLMRIDAGRHATSLDELESGGYLPTVPNDDGWGNPWVYTTDDGGYRLVSHGADGKPGPAPPRRWTGAPYAPDLILRNGELTQAPRGR